MKNTSHSESKETKGTPAPKSSTGKLSTDTRRSSTIRRLLDLRSGYQHTRKETKSTKKPAVKKPKAPERPTAKLLAPEAERTLNQPQNNQDKEKAKPSLVTQSVMKAPDIERLRRTLASEREKLMHDIDIIDEMTPSQMENGGTESNVFSIHLAEHATDNSTLETTLMQRHLIEERLSQVVEALQRLDQGSYGICEVCQKFIGVERLIAKPHARLCIECRRELERKRALSF